GQQAQQPLVVLASRQLDALTRFGRGGLPDQLGGVAAIVDHDPALQPEADVVAGLRLERPQQVVLRPAKVHDAGVARLLRRGLGPRPKAEVAQRAAEFSRRVRFHTETSEAAGLRPGDELAYNLLVRGYRPA